LAIIAQSALRGAIPGDALRFFYPKKKRNKTKNHLPRITMFWLSLRAQRGNLALVSMSVI